MVHVPQPELHPMVLGSLTLLLLTACSRGEVLVVQCEAGHLPSHVSQLQVMEIFHLHGLLLRKGDKGGAVGIRRNWGYGTTHEEGREEGGFTWSDMLI